MDFPNAFAHAKGELRQLIQEGINSGPAKPAKQVFAELRKRIDAIAQAHPAK